MAIVPFQRPTPQVRVPNPEPQIDDTYLAIAAAGMHEMDRLFEPLDITSQAQKADTQKTATDWPKGTSPEVRKTFDDRLKAGDITKDQYNKAMRDTRQFQDNP